MKTNPTPLTKEQIKHQFGKKKVVLIFYTGLKGQEIILESKLIERIEQTDDIDELAIHVKMPSKDTKEFREAVDQAIKQERSRVIQEIIDEGGFVAISRDGNTEVEYDLVRKRTITQLSQ